MWYRSGMVDDGGWAMLDDLHREVNRLFESPMRGAGYPPINVWANEDDVVVTAEVPGVDQKDLSVVVNGDVLTLQGERKAENDAEGRTYHRRERPLGRFSRTARLPYEVEPGAVKARYDRGVLTVTLPRKESTKPRQIEISTEEGRKA